MDHTGRELGGCEIQSLLGTGGMGAVYRARQLNLGRDVAVKTLAKGASAHQEEESTRFFLEARALAALNHPNIVNVHDVGEADDCYYMVMELVSGLSLGERIQADGPLDGAELMRIGAQVARGLQAAHAAGIVHRDIKPDNLLLTRDGTVKVVDFGVAKQLESDTTLTSTRKIVGSPAFMSPEQCLAGTVGPASDIYSLGVTLYFAMAGVRPFVGDTAAAVMMMHVNETATYDMLVERYGRDIVAVVARCLAKLPTERWASAGELAEVLERLASGGRLRPDELPALGPLAAPYGTPRSSRMAALLRRWRWPSLGAALVALVALVVWLWPDSQAEPPPPGAGQEVVSSEESPAPDPAPTESGSPVEPPPVEPPAVEADPAGPGEAPPPAADEPEPEATEPWREWLEQGLQAERQLELAEALRLLEEVAATVDLSVEDPAGAAVLAKLRAHAGHREEVAAALAAGNVDQALAAAGEALDLYRTPASERDVLGLPLAARQLKVVQIYLDGEEMEAAETVAAEGAGGTYRMLFERQLRSIRGYRTMLQAARSALSEERWEDAARALKLARDSCDTVVVRELAANLALYREAMARAEQHRTRGEPSEALAAVEEASKIIDSTEARSRIGELRFESLVTRARAEEDDLPRLRLLEEALTHHADAEVEAQASALRGKVQTAADQVVREALESGRRRLEDGFDKQAMTDINQPWVKEQLPRASAELQGQYWAMIEEIRRIQGEGSGTVPPARRDVHADAETLFQEAEGKRRSLNPFGKEERLQQALTTYQELIRRFPASPRIAASHYGAGRVLEELENPAGALQHYRAALRLCRDQALRAELERRVQKLR